MQLVLVLFESIKCLIQRGKHLQNCFTAGNTTVSDIIQLMWQNSMPSVRIYCTCSMQMSSDSIQWMGITDDAFLYGATARNLTVWSLNRVAQFWATARNRITSMNVVPAPEKSTRLVAVGEDNRY